MRERTILTFLLSLVLVAVAGATGMAAPAASASGVSVSGFEVDGDFAYPHVPAIAGATKDWATIASVSRGDDAADDSTDDVFGGGAKEEDPDGWTFDAGPKPPGKNDLTRFYAASHVTAAGGSLYLAFERLEVSGSGDTHADFEFNQKSTSVVNSKGATIPERSAGDLLVIYDYDGGGGAAGLEVRRWAGTALSGTWVLQTIPAGSAAAAVNFDPVTRPSSVPFGGGTVDTLRFAEAALDLTAIFGSAFPGCPGFAQVWVKTRSSGESYNSQLKDLGRPVPLTLSRCPDVHVAKASVSQTVDAGQGLSWTLTGTNDGIVAAAGVVVSDDLPDSLTGVTASYDLDPGAPGGTGTCTVAAGNVVTCVVGTLAASDGDTTGGEPDTAVVTVTADTTTSSCGVLHNRAHIDAASEALADRTDNDSNDTTATVRCPDLRLDKTGDASAVDAGSSIGYRITLTNTGSGSATAPRIQDTLPVRAGLSWSVESSSSGITCGIAGGVLTCDRSSLSPGASMSVHVVSPTTSASCGTIPNTASATAGNDAGSPHGAGASIEVRCPDVGIAKTTATAVVSAGETASYDLRIDNTGAGAASGVQVADVLPAGPAWSIVPSVPGCAIAGGTLSCAWSSLAAGSAVTIHVQAATTKTDCGTLDNSATVTATNEPTSATGNNSAGPVRIAVNCATIDVNKTPDASVVSAGEAIGFTIAVTNTGSGSALGVVVTDTLPSASGTSWSVDGGTAAGSCAIAAGVMTCSLGTMAAHATATVHVSSPTTAGSCGTITNRANVTTTNDGSDASEANVRVNCPQLRLEKTADTPSISAGQIAGFTLVLTSDGPGTAFGVTVSDSLPAGFAWSIDPAAVGCAIVSGTLTCALGSMPAGTSRTVHVQSPTTSSLCGTHPNTAHAASTNGGTAQGSASLEVRCAAVTIFKTEDSPSVSAGDPIGFTITVANTGSGDAFGVSLQDPLPAGGGLSWSVDGGSAAASCGITAETLSCALGTMSPGATRMVHVSSPTTKDSCRRIENRATVATGSDGSASSTAVVEVRCASVTVAKTADAATVDAGHPIGFTIAVGNAGAGEAKNVTLNDPLPAGSGIAWSVTSGPASGSCGIVAGTLTCTLGTLTAGASVPVHVSSPTTFASCGAYPNTASATATNDGSANASATTVVACPTLRLIKSADAAGVAAGDPIGFTMTVRNDGPGSAEGVTLSDPLPAGPGLSWSVNSGSGASSCSVAAGILSCAFGTMGADASVSVHVTSATSAASCGTYTNTATAAASNHPGVTAQATTEVACASIRITKVADDASVVAGDDIGFTVTVSNAGAGEARGVTILDVLPVAPGLVWGVDGGSAAGSCSITGGVLSCAVGSLAPGAGAAVHVSSPTSGTSCGPVENVASATTSNDGSAQANATVVVDCPAGIDIVKSGPALAHRGDTVVYRMTVTSTTISPLASVAVTDPMCVTAPAFVTGDDADALLEAGETWVFECSHVVSVSDPDPLPNRAAATGVGYDQTVTAFDEHVVDLIAPAITLDKTVDPASGSPGDTVVYTYVVRNSGDTALSAVTVTDDKLGVIGTIARLEAGESRTLTKTFVLGAAAVTNVGTASGEDVLGKIVTATDTARVTVVLGVKLVSTGTGPSGWAAGLAFVLLGGALLWAGRRRREQHE